MNIVVQGRPDGLGNRVEELINLCAYCNINNQKAIYIWRNKPQYWNGELLDRTYDIFFSIDNVFITTDKVTSDSYTLINSIMDNFTQKSFLTAAKSIKPNFSINFENNIKPLGVHIRGTDRINNKMNHPHFMKSEKQFKDLIERTVSYVNNALPKYLFICSDDLRYKQLFLSQLDNSIKIVEPISENNIPEEYTDFFGLTLCSEVVMCSKFSTFAITASLIGNIKLTAFYKDNSVRNRYKALMNYEVKSFNKKIFDVFNFFKLKL
jgi:hypothetical protein